MRVVTFVCVVLTILGAGIRAFGQSGDCRLIISGHVTEQDTNIKIRHALIHLKADNGDMLECATDSNGRYCFYYKKVSFHHAEISVAVDLQTNAVHKPRRFGYLATAGYGMIDTGDSARHYTKNFQLMPNQGCGSFPSVRFKKNTSVFDTTYTEGLDTVYNYPYQSIEFLASTLKDNPTIIIELSGHCSGDEKPSQHLSLIRTQTVKAELVTLGIDPERIVPVGYAPAKPLIKEDVIRRAQTKEEMMMLHAKNRRCVFRILSWDYLDTSGDILR